MKALAVSATLFLLLSFTGRAATVTQIFSQIISHHWMEQNDGGGNDYWSDGLIPSTSNDYVSPAGMILRGPEGNGAPDFEGNSLQIEAGATLSMKMNYGQDSFMLGDLIMKGGSLASWVGTTGNGYQFLDLNTNLFQVATNSTIDLTGANRRRIQLRNAIFSGTGAIQINGNADVDAFVLGPTVVASNFTGAWIINGGLLSVVDGGLLANTNQGVVININPAQPGIPSPTLVLNDTRVSTNVPLELHSASVGGFRTRIRAATGTNEWAGPISVNGDGSIQFDIQGATTEFRLAGGITGTNNTVLMFRGAAGVGLLSGNLIAPNATFVKTDDGRWIIASPTNRFAGLQLSVGTLEVMLDGALPTNVVVSVGQAGRTATLDLVGTRQTIAGLTRLAGTPTSQRVGNSSTTRDARLTMAGPGSNTFDGVLLDTLAGGTRTFGLTLDQGHHLNLGGNNPYTGSTLLSNSTLLVSGSVGGVVTAFMGSVYGGGGTCGSLSIEAGATHRPGFGGIGTDTVNGNYQLRGGLDLELDGNADRVDVSGALNLATNSSLSMTNLSSPNLAVYILAEYGVRNGRFGSTNGLAPGYRLVYDFGPLSNRIALVSATVFLWDGEAPGNSWASDTNWITDVAPPAITTNLIYFDIPGATTGGPGVQTSHLDRDRSIGGLNLAGDFGLFHTLDLTGFAMKVEGDMRMTEPGRDTVFTITNSLSNGGWVVTNGNIEIGLNGSFNTLRIDSGFTFFTTNGRLDLARRVGPVPSNTTATLDLSASTNVTITADEILMANATAQNGGLVRGILRLATNGSNVVTVNNILVGDSPLQGNSDPPASEIHFGGAVNQLYADSVTLGLRKCDVTVDALPGGSLRLRGRNKPNMSLRLGFNSAITGTLGDTLFDTSGALLDARFDQLELGQHNSGNGGGRGTFTMDAGLATASNVILAVTGGTIPANTRGILNVNGGAFHVADRVSDGNGAGTINVNDGLMVVTNHLMVDTLLVGGSGNNNATMRVGRSADIGTGSQTSRIARNTSNGTVSRGLLDLRTASNVVIHVNALEIGTGSYQGYGTLMLATNAMNTITAAVVRMGDVNPSGNQADVNRLITGGTTTIDANDIFIGQRKSRAEISMATNGTLVLGAPGDRINNLRVGFNNINTGTRGMGLLNGSNGALRVYANTVVLGRHDGTTIAGGWGTGTLIMESSNDVFDAVTMTLGHTDGGANATASGVLIHSNGNLQTDALILGHAKDFGTASGTVFLEAGNFVAHSIRQGLTSGVSNVDFNWTGGSLTSSNIALGEPLIQNGGTLTPGGASNIGSTTVTGDYTMASGAWDIGIEGTGPGSNDRVRVTGALSLSNAVLNLNPNGLDDAAYVIAEYSSRSGTFATVNNLPPGYSVVYDYGVGNNQMAVVATVSRRGTLIIVR